MNYTLDASVFVASARSLEAVYATSREFLRKIRAQSVDLFCPHLILPECAAAIARPTGDAALAAEVVTLIEGFPGLHLVALGAPLARRAAQIAALYRLRGADAVYIAVAEAFNATLVTWDLEMAERVRTS